jgi:hypothetical protein
MTRDYLKHSCIPFILDRLISRNLYYISLLVGSLLSSMHPFTYWVGRIISKVLALLQEITIFKDNTFQNLDLNWKFQFNWLHIYELKGAMREQNIS